MSSDKEYIKELTNMLLKTASEHDELAEDANERIAKLRLKVADLNKYILFHMVDMNNKVTRLEVIGPDSGRAYVKWDCRIETSYQDDGRTLKIFVRKDMEMNPDTI